MGSLLNQKSLSLSFSTVHSLRMKNHVLALQEIWWKPRCTRTWWTLTTIWMTSHQTGLTEIWTKNCKISHSIWNWIKCCTIWRTLGGPCISSAMLVHVELICRNLVCSKLQCKLQMYVRASFISHPLVCKNHFENCSQGSQRKLNFCNCMVDLFWKFLKLSTWTRTVVKHSKWHWQL